MNKRDHRNQRIAALAAMLLFAIALSEASAVTLDFEAPTYATGNLIGQDGWSKNTYFGALNGNVAVSNQSPLSGSQSLSYAQTVAGGFSDVNKANVLLVAPGVPGADLTLSYVIKATSNEFGAPLGGLFLQQFGGGGSSPIFARINGGIVEVGAAGGLTPVNDFFFSAGERLKMTYEVDFDESTMNLILENLDFGETISHSYPFFAGYGDPVGPNGEYQVSVAAFLRGGNVQIDDVILTANEGPISTEHSWISTGSGNWSQGTNWEPAGVPGSVPGRQKAILGNSITANATIFSNSARNLNSLEIDNVNSYVIAGAGSLDFQTDVSGPTPVAPTIEILNGHHQLQLPVNLHDDASITVASGASLKLNNQVDLNGNTLTISGDVAINHSIVGGGMVASLGSLEAEGDASIGGDFVSAGVLAMGVDDSGADSLSVAGDATLSGILDVKWTPGQITPATYAIVIAGGKLEASALALNDADARLFTLTSDEHRLMLTFHGAAVPEPSTFGMVFIGLATLMFRRRNPNVARKAATAAALVLALTTSDAVHAAVTGFENPPYSTGNLAGQDGWFAQGYVAVPNGTVSISTVNPLVGSQSLLYEQTSTTSFGSDVGKKYAIFGVADGTNGFDLTTSALFQTSANGIGSGSAGFFLGDGGRSPIFVRIDGAGAAGTSTGVVVGDGDVFPSVGTYIADHVFEFTINVDLDNQNYQVLSRDVTAGSAALPLLGSGPDGRFLFFGGNFGSTVEGVATSFDSSLLLRGGTARIDNLTLDGGDFVQAEWDGGSGDWNQPVAWLPHIVPNIPTENAPIAFFSNRFTSPQTIYANTTQTVNGLKFDNPNKHVIAGQGSIALKANTIGGTVNPTINVLNGAHELQIAVNLLENTAITVAAGAQLDFNNVVALGGKTLTTSGAVNLNVGVVGGGSIVNSGTLGTAGATPVAANLTSTGALQIDLGVENTDFFNITGNATLSGMLDVVLEPGFVPTGSYTVLTTSGTLNAAGLTLAPGDASLFTLAAVGKNLVLTAGGGGFTPGDFNKDGFVNGVDLAKWKGDFGGNANSDADNDGDSDGADFLIWQRNFGQTSATPAAAAVPEPASLILIASTLICCGTSSRRRRR